MKAPHSLVIEFDVKQHTYKQISFAELPARSETSDKIFWVHCNLNESDALKTINTKLALPDSVLKLCDAQDIMPKLLDDDEGLTIQVQTLQSTHLKKHHEPRYTNLLIHLTNNYCFTATLEPIAAVTELQESLHKAIRFAQTPCFILFLILDNVVTEYAKVLFNFEVLSEDLDLRVHVSHHHIYSKVVKLKQQVMKIKRYNIAIREMLVRISVRKISVVSEQCRASLSNLASHANMVVNEAASIRDILNNLQDQINNNLMQKMNEAMRVLTAFAAIFLPLSLITGIYGMNFRWMPELEWKYGYFVILGLIIGIAVLLLLMFKKKKWF